MKIAIAQINPVIGDFEYNLGRIQAMIAAARQDRCDLIVLPEMAISGYPPRDLLEKEDFVNANLIALQRLIRDESGIGVICGFVDKNPDPGGKPLFNSAILFEDGQILHRAHKRLLPSYDIFDESRYFEPGKLHQTVAYKGYQLGLSICEDAWNDKDTFKKQSYPVDPMTLMAEAGADLIVNIAASPFYMGKRDFRWKMLRAIAVKHRLSVIFANQVGGNDSVLFDGLSAAFDPQGEMRARASDFKEDMVIYETTENRGQIHDIQESDVASVLEAVIMGTRDYVSKCGFSSAVVGLSGGIDSALTAYIAVRALGPENVHTAFMPSAYTSQENYTDTEQLAQNLGITREVIPIDAMYADFVRYLSPDFNSESPGVTEQNIQARIRGTILMGLSNRDGHILLTTGNKSELAVGYCTLYGDMNGGLAVISDLPKTLVYGVCRFINQEKAILPQRILDKAPSAELKPEQSDQDDLPPYAVLDQILKAYIEDCKGADAIVKMGFEREMVEDILKKVDRNEYKRHQAPPGLKITSKAFGYGRRYPLAQRYSARAMRAEF